MVAELGLHVALLADEHRHHRVAEVAVEVQRLRHHRQEPAVEVLGPEGVVRWQTTGEVLDIVLLAVPRAAAGQELMDGVVVLDVRTLDIGADVVHPTLAALLHLFHDETLQLPVRQRLPLFEAQVVGTELGDALHHIVTQLVATGEEIFDAPHDALLLVHLRNGLAIVRFFIGISECLTDEVDAEGLETDVPRSAYHATFLRETGLGTVVGEGLQTLFHVFRTVVEGLRQTGLELQFDAFAQIVVGIPHHGAVVVGLCTCVDRQRILGLADHGQREGIRIVVELRIVAHATAAREGLFVYVQVAHQQTGIESRCTLVRIFQECGIVLSIKRFAALVFAPDDNL